MKLVKIKDGQIEGEPLSLKEFSIRNISIPKDIAGELFRDLNIDGDIYAKVLPDTLPPHDPELQNLVYDEYQYDVDSHTVSRSIYVVDKPNRDEIEQQRLIDENLKNVTLLVMSELPKSSEEIDGYVDSNCADLEGIKTLLKKMVKLMVAAKPKMT